jgi:hypothetical protein
MPTPIFLGGNEFIFYNQNTSRSRSKKSIKLVKQVKKNNSNIIGSNNIQDVEITINYNLNPLLIMVRIFLLINIILIITLIILIIQSAALNKELL